MDLRRPLYQMNEAARLLRLPDKTLRRWIDGDRRFDRVIDPLIRPFSTGSTDVTWGEFVEAGFLAEARHRRLPIENLRPLIARARASLDTPYPLAIAKPLWSDGLGNLTWVSWGDHNDALDVSSGGRGTGYQAQLIPVVESFAKRVEFTSVETRGRTETVISKLYPVGSDLTRRRISLDPEISFGLPSINGVRTETIFELSVGGEPPRSITKIYRHAGVTEEDIKEAVAYETSLRAA